MKSTYRTYMDSIDGNESLTKAEEKVLFIEAKQGNQKAVNKLLLSNLKFVVKVARHYNNQGVDLEDLISAGNIGLHRAIHEFDHTRNYKFISYAVNWIRAYIMEELATQSRFLKVNQRAGNQKSKIDKASDKLYQKLGRTPTLKELSEETKISIERLKEMEVLNPQSSLNAKVGDTELQNLIPDQNENNEISQDLQEKFLNFVNSAPLTDKQRDIITRYIGIGYEGNSYTLEEISEKYNVTRERIRVIKDDCLAILKRYNDRTVTLTPDLIEV
jgi:RNA polymerase primary sigma factor